MMIDAKFYLGTDERALYVRLPTTDGFSTFRIPMNERGRFVLESKGIVMVDLDLLGARVRSSL